MDLLNRGPYAAPGGMFTIHAAPWHWRAPFRTVAAATYRQIVDLGDPAASLWLPPTPGQSEDPFSSHYDGQIERWLSGGYVPIARGPSVHELTLCPQPACRRPGP